MINNWEVILLLLLISLFPLKESTYCFCLEGHVNCEEFYRLPNKFGNARYFNLTLITKIILMLINRSAMAFLTGGEYLETFDTFEEKICQ
jgi:hypothetical protein